MSEGRREGGREGEKGGREKRREGGMEGGRVRTCDSMHNVTPIMSKAILDLIHEQ